MRLSGFLVLAALPCAARIFPANSWTIADPCGGQPAWISSTEIVEESATSGSPCAYTFKPSSSIPLYDVKTITYSGSTWSGQTNLTSALRTGGSPPIPAGCSAGDPASDGTHLVCCTLSVVCAPGDPGPLWAFIYVEFNSPSSPQTAEVVAYGIN